MTSARTTRLTDLTAPPRPKPRYAPLTAGLLARKGEAAPATSFFTADAMTAHQGPSAGARMALPNPEREDDILAGDWAGEPRPHWRARRPVEEPYAHFVAPETNGAPFVHEPASATHLHVAHPAETQPEPAHAVLSVELGLEILARLALEARRSTSTPSRIIEAALGAHLAWNGHCPMCDSNPGTR